MKKSFFSFMALVMFAVNIAYAANVTVTMNATSTTMSLADKATGTAVAVGEPVNRVYTFEASAGTYVLTAYGTNGETINGTIELNVTEEVEQEFKVFTNTIYATNQGWVVDTDYTIEVTVSTREGVKQEITIGNSVTANRKTFLALNGNSYYAALIPSETHQAEDYMTFYKQGTLTNGITISGAIPQGADYTVTVPADAELFLGMKFSHFIAFTKVEPKSVENEGGNKKLTYRLANSQVYNYRTWKSGGLTQAGYFTMNLDVINPVHRILSAHKLLITPWSAARHRHQHCQHHGRVRGTGYHFRRDLLRFFLRRGASKREMESSPTASTNSGAAGSGSLLSDSGFTPLRFILIISRTSEASSA